MVSNSAPQSILSRGSVREAAARGDRLDGDDL
jgi:hypothetical protein